MKQQAADNSFAGIILCGGKSQRMGRDKASLPIGNRSMLSHTVQMLSQAVGPIVVVAAVGQKLPTDLPPLTVVRDRQAGQGPLEGIAVGLAALQGKASAAYVTGVDFPLLQSNFVKAVNSQLVAGQEIVLPCEGEHHHPLAAVYRLSILPVLEQLLSEGERRPAALFQAVRTLRLPVEQLRAVDPELKSLMNCNTPNHYAAALRMLET